MASVVSDEESFDDSLSEFSQCSMPWEDICEETGYEFNRPSHSGSVRNVVNNIVNRQAYGRFAKNPRAKTDRIFTNVHSRCRIALSSLIKGHEALPVPIEASDQHGEMYCCEEVQPIYPKIIFHKDPVGSFVTADINS